MNFYKLLLLLVFSTSLLCANSILVDNSQKTIDILSQSEIYVDHTRKLTIDSVQKESVKFQKNDKSLLGYGYSPDFDVWVKFTLKNTTDKKIERILEYDNTLTTNIEFYHTENSFIKEGSFNVSKERKTLAPTFKIVLDSYEEKTFYIKAYSQITTLIVKLNLWENDTFYEKEMKHQAYLALFFGAMTILALYNLFIFFFTKDVSYLFYVMYIFGIEIHHMVYIGMANVYLFNQSFVMAVIEYAVLIVAFPIVSLALFTKYFLELKQYKKLNIILNIFFVLISISIVFFIFLDLNDKYRNLLSILLFGYLLFVTIYATIKKNKQAYFILFGWFIIFDAVALMFLSSAGVLNIFDDFPYIVELSLVLEAVIFSIALANRIKQLQKDKNEINEKLILQEKEEGKRLKVQVEEKTRDLKEALEEKNLLLKELSHRVKNNMQTIVSLIRLQADEIDDEKVEDIFSTVQNRINAMSHLHELLYRQDSISHVNAFDYFDLMIDDLKQSYNTEKVKIDLDIKTDLQIEQAIYCGLILNELITNAIKYAFDGKNGTIYISLQKDDSIYKFTIKDDGIGFDTSKETDSLGLLLVETLSKKQLGGDINIDTSDGVKVDIMWRENDKNKSFNSRR